MIAIDWSYVKQLATYDGTKARIEIKEEIVKRVHKYDNDVVVEQECPLSLIHYFLMNNVNVYAIDNKTCHNSHLANGTVKTDINDAIILWQSSNNKSNLKQITFENKPIKLYDLYHQYNRFMKARVAISNMKLSHERCFGIGESKTSVKSIYIVHPMPDLSYYDDSINLFLSKENELRKLFDKLLNTKSHLKNINIKGLGKRLWFRIAIIANPNNFKCLSSYLRYCGLTDISLESHKFNRHAKQLYRLLAESMLRINNKEYRALYDKIKFDISKKHEDYTKGHIHNATLNRIATLLAKRIFEYGKNNTILNITETEQAMRNK
jgi:hypothetical protein